MRIWAMSLKSRAKKGHDPFSFCRKERMVGIGFALKRKPENKEDALGLFEENPRYQTGRNPYNFRTFLTDITRGDLVWVHKKGRYFLCKIRSDWKYKDTEEHGNNDVYNVRKARWKEIPDVLVPGCVKRSLTVPGTLRPVSRINDSTRAYFKYLSRCKDLGESLNVDSLTEVVDRLRVRGLDLFEILEPDECEDLVVSKLQDDGWMLIKSSCYKSHSKYECDFKRIEGKRIRRASLQVRSGNRGIDVAEFLDDATEERAIFLFSTRLKEPYRNKDLAADNPNIHLVRRDEVIDWVSKIENLPKLPDSTLMKLYHLVRS